jgi:AraC-like DNA-binding protein
MTRREKATDGETLVVSLRTLKPRFEPLAEPSPRGPDARQLPLVIGTIQEKIGEPISVSMLSTIAGLSRSHFSQAFRTSVGRTPRPHIVRLRIERAMKLRLCRHHGDAPANLHRLVDSPAGQAAWIYDRFAAWTDPDGEPEKALTRDEMLDDVTLYRLTNTGSLLRGSTGRIMRATSTPSTFHPRCDDGLSGRDLPCAAKLHRACVS